MVDVETPEIVIMFDRDDKKTPFWVRWKVEGGIDFKNLDGELTLPGAVNAADKLGIKATHWAYVGSSYASEIPKSIVRRHI